jgi:hypothetical protein
MVLSNGFLRGRPIAGRFLRFCGMDWAIWFAPLKSGHRNPFTKPEEYLESYLTKFTDMRPA